MLTSDGSSHIVYELQHEVQRRGFHSDDQGAKSYVRPLELPVQPRLGHLYPLVAWPGDLVPLRRV